MRKMSEEKQMNTNGGMWTHCAKCGKSFWSLSKKKAINKAYNCHRWWGYGKFVDCTICK